MNASTLKKTDAGKDRRARACRRTARPRAAARRGPLCEYDLRRRNDAAEKRQDAGSRRGDGQGSSGTSGTVRGDDVRRVRTERTEPAPRSATRDGPDATCVDIKFTPSTRIDFHTGRHGVGVVVVFVARLGRGRGRRRARRVEPLEGRARVPEPELDAGGLERRQRRARALGAPAVVVAWGSAAAS